MQKESELLLSKECARGKKDAQSRLYSRYSPRLLALCLRYTGDYQEAQDLLHDGFIKIFGNIKKFNYRHEGCLGNWLSTVMRNECLQYLKKKKKAVASSLSIEDIDIPEEEDEVPDIYTVPKDVLLEYIAELPDGYRTVFNLYVIDGFSHNQIAGILGINAKSSSSQLSRAKKILASRVIKYKKSCNG